MSDSLYNNKSFEVWNFPALEGFGERFEPLEPEVQDEVQKPDDSEVPVATCYDNSEERNALIEQIHYLDGLGFQMKSMLADIDESLLVNLVTLVRKTVKKVVAKEMALDNNVLKDMVIASLARLHRDDEVCVVHISEEDQAVFEQGAPLHHVVIKTDAALKKGDYVIKSRFSELEAILEQRIDTLLEI